MSLHCIKGKIKIMCCQKIVLSFVYNECEWGLELHVMLQFFSKMHNESSSYNLTNDKLV